MELLDYKKWCYNCNRVLSKFHFYHNISKLDGCSSECIECIKNINHNNLSKRRISQKIYRHRIGLSKKYNGIPKNIIQQEKEKEKIRLRRKRYKYSKILAGKLSIKTIQLIYEDNIKKYGTLTCYLCEKPIKFGQDSLEHKTPLSRGGTNEYNNLAIACIKCNCKKNARTEIEYREVKKL